MKLTLKSTSLMLVAALAVALPNAYADSHSTEKMAEEMKAEGMEKMEEMKDEGMEKMTEMKDEGMEKMEEMKDEGMEKMEGEMKEGHEKMKDADAS